MENNKKEELFDKIIGLKYVRQGVPKNWYNKGVDDSFRYIKNFFDKEFVPEVPQYVADWYEENKDNIDYEIWKEISNKPLKFEYDEKPNYWIEDTDDAIITLVKMHLFGYKIKDDKKYLVRMIGIISGDNYLNYDSKNKKWYFDNSINSKDVKSYHTRKDLNESGFGDVFNSPLFEVEEVE